MLFLDYYQHTCYYQTKDMATSLENSEELFSSVTRKMTLKQETCFTLLVLRRCNFFLELEGWDNPFLFQYSWQSNSPEMQKMLKSSKLL